MPGKFPQVKDVFFKGQLTAHCTTNAMCRSALGLVSHNVSRCGALTGSDDGDNVTSSPPALASVADPSLAWRVKG